jgi:hypothetical protein
LTKAQESTVTRKRARHENETSVPNMWKTKFCLLFLICNTLFKSIQLFVHWNHKKKRIWLKRERATQSWQCAFPRKTPSGEIRRRQNLRFTHSYAFWISFQLHIPVFVTILYQNIYVFGDSGLWNHHKCDAKVQAQQLVKNVNKIFNKKNDTTMTWTGWLPVVNRPPCHLTPSPSMIIWATI